MAHIKLIYLKDRCCEVLVDDDGRSTRLGCIIREGARAFEKRYIKKA